MYSDRRSRRAAGARFAGTQARGRCQTDAGAAPYQRDSETAPSASQSWRLFLALWPTAAVHAQLLRHADAWQWPAQARRVAPARWHVTLQFLGAWPLSQLAALQQALRLQTQPFELLLDRPRLWPGGLAVLEAQQVPPPLARLHAQLGERLQALGGQPQARPLRPHVTLARRAAGARPPADPPPLRWPADGRFALVRSLPQGAGYLPLQVFG